MILLTWHNRRRWYDVFTKKFRKSVDIETVVLIYNEIYSEILTDCTFLC